MTVLSQLNIAAGSKLFIGQTLTTTSPDQATYEAMTWTQFVEVEDLGTVGDAAADVTFESMDDGRTRHFPGPFDAGTSNVVVGFVQDDPAQVATSTAFSGRLLTAFKIEMTDRPDTSHTNTIKYFGARVLSFSSNIGNARNVVRRNMTLGINTPITEVGPQVIT